jgi:urease accessory protein
MDGDGQLVQIAAGPGTRAVVTGQSATRIHPAVSGYSTQQWQVDVATGAVLVVLPGPAIPFQGCRYYQRVSIHLAEGANLVWGDIWLAGRYARGLASEQFQFEIMVQDFTVRRKGRLIFRDRFCWLGPWDADTAAWHFGEHPACVTLFVTGELAEATPPEVARFTTAAGDTCLRWCGASQAVAASMVATALRAAAVQAGGRPGNSWLPADALAPNHWFFGGVQ